MQQSGVERQVSRAVRKRVTGANFSPIAPILMVKLPILQTVFVERTIAMKVSFVRRP